MSLAAAALGALLWAVPLVVASGGWSGYLNALGSQAGEDFSGVVMLWTNRSPRVAVQAVLNTFVRPWDWPILAGVMLALAGGGLLLLATRRAAQSALAARPLRRDFTGLRTVLLLAVMFGPYALFHIMFQETATVRYSLPLVVPIAYLAATAVTSARRSGSLVVSVGLVLAMLLTAVPAAIGYARTPSPIFSAFADMGRAPQPAALAAMHRRIWTESRRARRWTGEPKPPLLAAPRDYEWLELSRAWRAGDSSRTWFVADPRRTDLALIDPASRSAVSYRWPFQRSGVCRRRPAERSRSGHHRQARLVPGSGVVADAGSGGDHAARWPGTASAPERWLDPAADRRGAADDRWTTPGAVRRTRQVHDSRRRSTIVRC